MTGNPSMLENLCPYLCNDNVIIGDDDSHAITYVCNTYIDSSFTKIKLKNFLLAPALAKNLLSIEKITTDCPCHCEFYGIGFVVKEQETNYVY